MARPTKAVVGTRIACSGKGWLALGTIASVMLLATSALGQKSEVEGLIARIAFEKPRYRAREPINIVVTFENTSEHPLAILKWFTPFEGFFSNMFIVRHEKDDKAVRYIGRLAKRTKPTARDYFVIPPREAVRKVLDLSEGYEIRRAGVYTVQLQTFIQGSGKVLAPRRELKPLYVESNLARFELPQPQEPPPPEPKLPPFNECDPKQEKDLEQALVKAQDIAFDALGMLNSTAAADRPNSTRYTNWFGAHSAARYGTAVAHFEKIALAVANEEINFNCECTTGELYSAHVGANEPYEITVCSPFWTMPIIGSDSRSGTIVHEVSHFYVVAGTDEDPVGYNRPGSEYLALSDPDRALENANNHEYFAANYPPLTMAGSPGWTSCAWHQVGYNKSHFKQQQRWCPAGSFVTGFDLDNDILHGGPNSPIVGKVQCCKLAANNASAWGPCSWQPVGYDKSHIVNGNWCPAGSLVTDLDLDGDSSQGAGNGPIVGEVRCCDLPSGQLPSWGKSYWFDVGHAKSHRLLLETWCPAGSFVTQLDLDGGAAVDWPVVGRVRCTAPAPCPPPCAVQGDACALVCGGPLEGKCVLGGSDLQCAAP